MFEQLGNYLISRDYFGAGAILTALGSMFRPKPPPPDDRNCQLLLAGFDGAQHVFLVVDSVDHFWSLPGDVEQSEIVHGQRIMSKVATLPACWNQEYPAGIMLHFLHVFAVDQLGGRSDVH